MTEETLHDISLKIARLEERLEHVRRELASIKATIRWIGITIGGALLLAISQWIIGGGLAGATLV